MKKYIFAALTLLVISIWTAPADCAAARKQDKVIKVLAIGNSFSEDSIEQNLWQIANSQGVKMVVANMYIGGCSIDRHHQNIVDNKHDYRYCKIDVNGKKVRKGGVSLSDVIADEQWDYVSIQQVSQEAGRPQSYGNLEAVVGWIRANAPQAEVVFHQTWAYSPNSSHGGFIHYGKNQGYMYTQVVNVTHEQANKVGIKRIIPTGTALQDARTSHLGKDLTRDGFHMSKDFGRYMAACTWFEALTGMRVKPGAYIPDGKEDGTLKLNPEDAPIAWEAAHKANRHPYEVHRIRK